MTGVIGRDAERRVLSAHVRDAPSRSHAVALIGTAGSGKTALVREAVQLATSARLRVLEVSGAPGDGGVPFSTLRRSLLAWGEAVAGLDDLHAELATVTGPPEGGQRVVVDRGLDVLLAGLAADGPTILLVDGLDACDEASALSLCDIVRRAPPAGLLSILTTRGYPELSAVVAAELARLVDDGAVTRVEVRPWRLADVLGLVPATVDRTDAVRVAELVHARTGGVALFTLAVVEELSTTGAWSGERVDPAVDRRIATMVPERVAVAVLDRITRLGAVPLAAARVLAVAGELELRDVGTLAALAAALQDVVDDALDRLIHAGIVEVAPGSVVRFSSNLVRDAVLRDLGQPRARSIHAALGRAYATRAVDDDEALWRAATHFLAADLGTDPRAAEVFERAARRCVHRAPHDAVDWFRAALAATSAPTLGLQLGLVEAMDLAGSHTAAAELASRVLGAGPVDGEDHEQAILVAANSRLRSGDVPAAALLLETAIDAADDPSPRLYVSLARVANWMDDFTRARRHLTDAVARGLPPDDPVLRAVGCYVDVATGRFDAAAATVEDLHLLLDSLEPEAQAEVRTTIAAVASTNFHPATALDVAHQADAHPMAPFLHACRAAALVRQGRFNEAVDAARTGVDRSDVPGGPGASLCWPALITAHTELDVMDAAASAWRDALTSRHQNVPGVLDAAVARFLVAEDRMREAADVVDRALERERRSGRVNFRPGLLAVLVRLALHHDDDRAARRALDELLAIGDHASAVALTMHQRSCTALVERDPDAAAEARAYARDHGLLADAATMLAFESVLRIDPSGLQAAYREFAVIGAVRRQRRVARRLAELGASVPNVATGGQLTARELEIARLVATGATNTEIARALHLSVKTVEASLTRTYAKTGHRSRVELAMAYGDGSLGPAPPDAR